MSLSGQLLPLSVTVLMARSMTLQSCIQAQTKRLRYTKESIMPTLSGAFTEQPAFESFPGPHLETSLLFVIPRTRGLNGPVSPLSPHRGALGSFTCCLHSPAHLCKDTGRILRVDHRVKGVNTWLCPGQKAAQLPSSGNQ